ncbi:peptidylprolyl isomerase [Alkalilimnicola ehrlichii]|uniref:peptidylprolyl isomerase n=1 Tax=Alkalilimnicola ehrlichii TaxID=351052 RepID=UPI003BA28A98
MTIEVNGVEITHHAINIESAHHKRPELDPREAQEQAALALTLRELLRQRALQLDLEVPEDDSDDQALDAVIDRLIELEVDVPQADEATCRRWFEQNPDHFRTPDLAEVRHILVAGHPEDLEEREQARQTAEGLIRQLQADPAAFPALAAAHSRCPSSEQGGLLGQVSRGETVPEFEDAVLRLPVGLSPQPIKTRYGFHVVEVLQRIPGTALPFEAVHERIAEYLEAVSRQRALNQYLRLLVGEADIKGIQLDGNTTPLTQ